MADDVFDSFLGRICIVRLKDGNSFASRLVARDRNMLLFEAASGRIGATACDAIGNILEVKTGDKRRQTQSVTL
jgi:hypothetical protein